MPDTGTRIALNIGLHCSVEDQRRLLAASPYFRSLSPDDIEQVQRDFLQRHYLAGSQIYAAGQPATRLSIVAAGAVKVLRPARDGKDVVLDILVPGDQFGSLAELGDQIYRDTAIAHTECCILSTTSEKFARMLQDHPGVALDTLGLVSARLRDAQSTIEHLSSYPVEQRLASTLLRLVDKIGRDDGGVVYIDIPLGRQDIAEMTGTTVESSSRVLSEFKREGLIDSGRRWIAVKDVDELRIRAAN